MLVLTRRAGEVLNIGADIEVCILGINGNQARIGVTAAKEVEVHREEVYRRIQQQRAQPQTYD